MSKYLDDKYINHERYEGEPYYDCVKRYEDQLLKNHVDQYLWRPRLPVFGALSCNSFCQSGNRM